MSMINMKCLKQTLIFTLLISGIIYIVFFVNVFTIFYFGEFFVPFLFFENKTAHERRYVFFFNFSLLL